MAAIQMLVNFLLDRTNRYASVLLLLSQVAKKWRYVANKLPKTALKDAIYQSLHIGKIPDWTPKLPPSTLFYYTSMCPIKIEYIEQAYVDETSVLDLLARGFHAEFNAMIRCIPDNYWRPLHTIIQTRRIEHGDIESYIIGLCYYVIHTEHIEILPRFIHYFNKLEVDIVHIWNSKLPKIVKYIPLLDSMIRSYDATSRPIIIKIIAFMIVNVPGMDMHNAEHWLKEYITCDKYEKTRKLILTEIASL